MKKIFLIVLTLPLCSFIAHKYYVSLTEIEFKENKKSVEIIMNVFIDDIELALNKSYQIDSQLSTKKELKNIDGYFLKYLQDNFKITIDNKNTTYTFLGKQYEGDLVFFYLEIENVSAIDSISIHNTMLLQYFKKQQNLIKVTANEKRKSLFLDSEKYSGVLKF